MADQSQAQYPASRTEEFNSGKTPAGFNYETAGTLAPVNYHLMGLGTGPNDVARLLPGQGGKPMLLPSANATDRESMMSRLKFPQQ